MSLALIIICVFFISTADLTAQNAISDDILYNDINSLYGCDTPEFSDNECRNTQQTAIESHSTTTIGYLFDNWLINKRPEKAVLTIIQDRTKRRDYFDNKWTKLASTDYHSMHPRTEISLFNRGRDDELANNPSHSNNYYDKVVFFIKDAYHAWAAIDYYDFSHLFLLSFGLVGFIGVRRKFKKG